MKLPVVWNGLDNRLICRVMAKGQSVNLSGVSRIVLAEAGQTLVDSAVRGAGPGQAIDWSQGTGLLVLYLGHEGIAGGANGTAHELYAELFCGSTPNGIRSEPVRVVFRGDDPEGAVRYPALSTTPPSHDNRLLDMAAVYTLVPAELLPAYVLGDDGVIRDENGDPITDELGSAITEG